MFVFTSSLALIISMFITNVDANSEATNNVTNEISSIYFNIEEFQKSLSENNPSMESLVKIVKDLSSILISMISHLESSKSFEADFVTKMQNLDSEMEELRKDVNETECSLSIRIIDIENDISKIKDQPKFEVGRPEIAASQTQTNSSVTERKTVKNREFFLTPSLTFLQAKTHCNENGGAPFVPKTKEEFSFILTQITAEANYVWLPIRDLIRKTKLAWEDRTSFEDSPVHFELRDYRHNSDLGCVMVSANANAFSSHCHTKMKMLCVKTEEV